MTRRSSRVALLKQPGRPADIAPSPITAYRQPTDSDHLYTNQQTGMQLQLRPHAVVTAMMLLLGACGAGGTSPTDALRITDDEVQARFEENLFDIGLSASRKVSGDTVVVAVTMTNSTDRPFSTEGWLEIFPPDGWEASPLDGPESGWDCFDPAVTADGAIVVRCRTQGLGAVGTDDSRTFEIRLEPNSRPAGPGLVRIEALPEFVGPFENVPYLVDGPVGGWVEADGANNAVAVQLG